MMPADFPGLLRRAAEALTKRRHGFMCQTHRILTCDCGVSTEHDLADELRHAAGEAGAVQAETEWTDEAIMRLLGEMEKPTSDRDLIALCDEEAAAKDRDEDWYPTVRGLALELLAERRQHREEARRLREGGKGET